MSKKKFILFALVASLVLSFAGSAFAAVGDTFHWTGAVSNVWNLAGNWSKITANGAGAWPGAALGTTPDTARINGSAGVIIFPEEVGAVTPASATYLAGPFSIEIEGAGTGVEFKLGESILFNTLAAGPTVKIEARSNLTFSALDGLRTVGGVENVPSVNFRTLAAPDFVIFDVLENVTVKFNVPVGYQTAGAFASLGEIRKDAKGSVVFTKPYFAGGAGDFDDLLDITIQDGTVEIPSGVSDRNKYGTILGGVTFDYETTHTGNRYPTLKVTGNDTLYWPVTAVPTVPYQLTVTAQKGNSPDPNATIYVDRGATLGLGYFTNPNLTPQLITGEEGGVDTVQSLVKAGGGGLDLYKDAIGYAANTRFLNELIVAEGTVYAPYGTTNIPAAPAAFTDGELLRTAVTVEKGATFKTGGGEHHTIDPKYFTTSVGSFWGKLGSTLDVVSGNFDIYGNQSAANSIISGDIIGAGTLGAVKLAANLNDTVVEVHGSKNTYKGGTYISPNAAVSLYRQNSLGTGPIVGQGGAVSLASAGSNWIDLPNKIELAYLSGGLTFDVPAGKLVKQTAGVAYTDALLTKTGSGELVLAGEGEASWRGDFNWITTANLSLSAVEGTVVLDHNKAVGHAGVAVSDGAVVRTFNGFSGDNAFYLMDDANATPTLDSAIGAVLSNVAPALVTAESFATQGDFEFQIYPRSAIKKGDTVAVLKAGDFNIDLSKFDATVTDVAGKKFTTLAVAEAADNTLELTAAKDIDVPTVTATGLTADTKANIAITVKVASTTPISKNVTVITDIPGMRVSDVDVAGRTFNIYGVAPETDATYPVRVYVTTVGDWVTDTVDTDGITVYEDFVLTVGSGGDVPPTPPVTGPAWTLSGAINDALTELTGTVAFTYDGNPLNADLAVTVSVSDEAGAAVGTPAEVTLPAGATGTAVEFSIPAAYKTGTTYTLRAATGNTTYDVANTRPISKSGGGGDDNRGGSGGGCDAGFGLFGLLAATGVVTLLRKKG